MKTISNKRDCFLAFMILIKITNNTFINELEGIHVGDIFEAIKYKSIYITYHTISYELIRKVHGKPDFRNIHGGPKIHACVDAVPLTDIEIRELKLEKLMHMNGRPA